MRIPDSDSPMQTQRIFYIQIGRWAPARGDERTGGKLLLMDGNRGITFSSNGNRDLRVFYDASNRGDYADEKAQYGFACMLYNGPVQWASRKQRHVGTSSTHNEYMALFHACVDTVWFRKLLNEAGLSEHVQNATIALGDNDQATRLSYEDIVTSGNRMIRNNYHFVKMS